jgi:hypothetical protein
MKFLKACRWLVAHGETNTKPVGKRFVLPMASFGFDGLTISTFTNHEGRGWVGSAERLSKDGRLNAVQSLGSAT